jgi:hypothetical protein
MDLTQNSAAAGEGVLFKGAGLLVVTQTRQGRRRGWSRRTEGAARPLAGTELSSSWAKLRTLTLGRPWRRVRALQASMGSVSTLSSCTSAT